MASSSSACWTTPSSNRHLEILLGAPGPRTHITSIAKGQWGAVPADKAPSPVRNTTERGKAIMTTHARDLSRLLQQSSSLDSIRPYILRRTTCGLLTRKCHMPTFQFPDNSLSQFCRGRARQLRKVTNTPSSLSTYATLQRCARIPLVPVTSPEVSGADGRHS